MNQITDELPPVTGPRRYRVSFNCRTDAVGTVIGLLIKEVEQPKMETINDSYKLTLVCMQDQLVTVLGVIIDHADELVVAPFHAEVKMAPAVFRPQKPVHVPTPLQREVTVLPAQRKNSGPSKTKDTTTGKVVLGVFKDGGRVKHPADFVEALTAAQFSPNSYASIVNRLVVEGDLVRVGHGAYRLPTTQDHLRMMEERDSSFSPQGE